MEDDDRVSARFNLNEADLKNAFYETLAEAKKKRPGIAKGDIVKKLMRRGLEADADRGRAASVVENELAIIHAQVGEIAQNGRTLAAAMDAIREDLATTVLVLLQHAGKLDAAKAQKWFEEKFKS